MTGRIRAGQLLVWLLLAVQKTVQASIPIPAVVEITQKCVSGFCLPLEYQKLETPFSDTFNTVKVTVEIMDVLQVNDKEFSVTLTMYFSVQWEEPRITTNNTVGEGEWTPIDLQFLNNLWVPNIFIYDLRSFSAMSVLKKLAGVWIVEGKAIYYNQASSVTFLCPMRFDLYPLDSHVCKFRVGSTNLDMTRMRFAPTELTYDETTRNTILDYAVTMGRLHEDDRILPYGELGNYSITGIEITFTRHKLKYLIVYYLPSGLFVVVSWASFLIPPEVVPGRMAMLITLFLVLINIFNIVTTNSPNVEGMTAIAAWMVVCIFFVFGALAGYAWLLWKKKKSCLKRKRLRKLSEEEGKLRTRRKEEFRSKVDDMFLVTFPLLFALFNLIYWPMCIRTNTG
ncbi:hypothetical protein TCAL_14393 [Tigriopus californicus]|uniref:Uncharacterized protein n=1 Tax=Tigriopus californicus TaxID=6832 RepID=A0A553PL93_TIGCA|nr:glutamate-gated chloride channel subunit beta-like [Tigriopus californicus]TRY78448.1 hypothetical protein TCAL_14393 [Tigriopus californicus]